MYLDFLEGSDSTKTRTPLALRSAPELRGLMGVVELYGSYSPDEGSVPEPMTLQSSGPERERDVVPEKYPSKLSTAELLAEQFLLSSKPEQLSSTFIFLYPYS
jgi:hypothetical protein